MTLDFDSRLPVEVKSAAESLIEKWNHILPSWVGVLHVLWDENNTESCAVMTVQPRYRSCTLWICPNFLTSTLHEREHVVIHEMCHAYTTPIATAGKEAVQDIVGSDYPTPGSKVADRRIDDSHEGCTEDIANLIERLTGTKTYGC